MGKAKGITTIHDKEPVRKLAAFAVEYEDGSLYWDRTGRVCQRLFREDKGWMSSPTIAQGQAQVTNPEAGLVFVVSPTTAFVRRSTEGQPEGIEDEDIGGFADRVATVLGVVVDEFELPQFQRVEYREAYYFACASVEESETWLKDLGIVRIAEEVYSNFGGHYAMTCALLTVGEDCRYRIEVKGMERNASVPVGELDISIRHSRAKQLQRAELLTLLQTKRQRQVDPACWVALEIQAYLWDDTNTDFDIRGFVTKRAAGNLEMFRRSIPKKG